MLIILFSLVIIYSALILFYTLKFLFHKDAIPTTPTNLEINIVTAAKNEEENIDKFLSCISSQNYQNSEFILVDDHSSDDTYRIASEYKQRYNFILCHNNGNGKKAALRTALTHCNAPYILFTDADCYSNPQWTTIMAASAQHTKADIILAPLIIKADNQKSIFQRLWQTESLAILTLTAGAAIAGHPIMCNGGNMMVNTALRNTADAYIKDHYRSGDDIFLLQFAVAQNKKVIFVKSGDSVVYTHSPQTLRTLIRQRARWAGKVSGYTDKVTILVAALVFGANISILLAIGLWAVGVIDWYIFLLVWIIKFAADAFSVIIPAKYYKIPVKLIDIFVLAVIYPVYTVVCTGWGLFRKKSW
ncbi:MAG: glycosyltransferase [Bacteroidales bacterium]|nr:glycosyltransferase [Bacteroidales bacterium]